MQTGSKTSLELASYLLEIKAIKLNDAEPFTWASGRKSPIYCDNRITLSYPEVRTFICNKFVETISQEIGLPDAIAGVATGGIPQGALVAQALGLPFVYVRPEAKKHGLGQQIEGQIKEGSSVVVVEDLISTGSSSLKAVEALKAAGCTIKGMVAIFTYNLDVAIKAFETAKIPLFALSNYNDLIHKAVEIGALTAEEKTSLAKWRESPEEWSNAHINDSK